MASTFSGLCLADFVDLVLGEVGGVTCTKNQGILFYPIQLFLYYTV